MSPIALGSRRVSWLGRFSRAENFFLGYWNASEDILLRPIAPGTQRKLLASVYRPKPNLSWASRLILVAQVLFFIFTLYQVVFGTYQSVLFSFGHPEGATNHFFHYGIVTTYLDFWRQPHLVLAIHGVSGTIFLVTCLLQVALVRVTLFPSTSGRSDGSKFHRWLGSVCLLSSLFASSSAIVLSFRALHGTEIVYLLGTSSWFFFTVMTIIRGVQGHWIAHSRWALALQQIGLMFVSTRLFAPLLLYLNVPIEHAYHWAVWLAGATAIGMFGISERARQNVLVQRLDSRNQTPNLEHSSTYEPLHRAMFWSLLLGVFIGAPLLFYVPSLSMMKSLTDSWLVTQATLLFLFFSVLIFGKP